MKLRLQQTIPVVLVLFLVVPASAQDIDAGKRVFARCAACHNVETATNKLGPHLQDVVGRTAGSLEGYSYSKAMTDAGAAGLVWDEATIGEYLTNPKASVPGTKMAFAGLRRPEEIRDVIAYIESVSGEGKP